MPVFVRAMQENDLPEAARIFRLAFGTFLGVPDPASFCADVSHVETRWRANPEAALAAELDGRLAGSNFAAGWGSFGFFGPLTIHPEFWDQRIGQALLAPTLDIFANWGVREAGLFTFAHSPKHIALYQKFGFWPRFLTAVLSKKVNTNGAGTVLYSALNQSQQAEALSACRALTDAIHDGLDVTSEILSVNRQHLGDTVLLWEGDSLDALAICHCGEGTEAGRRCCYLKFAAAGNEKSFVRLLAACESLAAARGLERIEAGVNLARSCAYRRLLELGFRTQMQGVAMQRPDGPGYNRPDVFVVDDWR
ncbi:MAG TPA: GNAT family N-acetyltransferase [Bryobacteraceae bacterium]